MDHTVTQSGSYKETLSAFLKRFGLLLVYLMLIMGLSLMSDRFFTVSNQINIFRQATINGIVAVGMTLVILTAGIDLSVGSVPFIIVPPTSTIAPSSGGGGGGAPLPPPALDCTPVNNVPRDNTVFHKNDTFDIKWTIKNTGTKTIPAKLDVKYFSGPDMAPGQSPFELPVDIKPGETFVIDLDGEAPDKLGFHVMTWVVEGNLCYPYVAIIVE